MTILVFLIIGHWYFVHRQTKNNETCFILRSISEWIENWIERLCHWNRQCALVKNSNNFNWCLKWYGLSSELETFQGVYHSAKQKLVLFFVRYLLSFVLFLFYFKSRLLLFYFKISLGLFCFKSNYISVSLVFIRWYISVVPCFCLTFVASFILRPLRRTGYEVLLLTMTYESVVSVFKIRTWLWSVARQSIN